MDTLTVKNKAIQTDMLREAARIMQLAACIDDTYAHEINELIYKVEEKAAALGERIGEPIPVRPERPKKHPKRQDPKLTIV